VYILILFLIAGNTLSWPLLIAIYFSKRLEKVFGGQDGVYFCHSCNYVVGHRVSGVEFVNGNFVERRHEILPENVIRFKSKREINFNEDF